MFFLSLNALKKEIISLINYKISFKEVFTVFQSGSGFPKHIYLIALFSELRKKNALNDFIL